MPERYDTMPPLSGSVAGTAKMPPPSDIPAFVRRVRQDHLGGPMAQADWPPLDGTGQPPVAALLEIGDELIKRLEASHDRLSMLADRYLGPQPHPPLEPVHRALAWDDGLAVSAVRKLEVIHALVTSIDRRIEAFERL